MSSNIQSTKDLRNFLTTKLNEVAEGKVDAKTTTAIANLAQQIYNTLNIEIKIATAKANLDVKNIDPVKF